MSSLCPPPWSQFEKSADISWNLTHRPDQNATTNNKWPIGVQWKGIFWLLLAVSKLLCDIRHPISCCISYLREVSHKGIIKNKIIQQAHQTDGNHFDKKRAFFLLTTQRKESLIFSLSLRWEERLLKASLSRRAFLIVAAIGRHIGFGFLQEMTRGGFNDYHFSFGIPQADFCRLSTTMTTTTRRLILAAPLCNAWDTVRPDWATHLDQQLLLRMQSFASSFRGT